MTTRKRTPGGIPASTLAANITAGATSLTLAAGAGASWPTNFPYDIIVNRASATSRERMTVGGMATDTLNSLTRPIDGTTAQAHNIGDTVEVCVAGSYLDELGQLLGGAAGDLYYYDGSNLVKLAKGTAEQMLKQGASAPSWSWQALPKFASTGARTTAIPSPADGDASYLNAGDATEGPEFYNGTAWRRPWNMPWGVGAGGQVSSTSDQTGITTVADVTFATITWTAVVGRLYEITLSARAAQVTSAGTQTMQIHTGASGAGTLLKEEISPSVAAGSLGTGTIVGYQTGSGSISVHARALTSAGTLTIGNAATKGWFTVKDVGPTGNPA